jgi:hypothetical protein
MLSRSTPSVQIQLEVDGRILRGEYVVGIYFNFDKYWELPTPFSGWCCARNFPYLYRLQDRERWELRVYYYGRRGSKFIKVDRETNIDLIARQIFRQLIDKHYTPIERIDPNLPLCIRQAAFNYANSFEDEELDSDYGITNFFVESFGSQSVGSVSHNQVSWLCLNALKCVIPAWTTSCNLPTARNTLNQLLEYMRQGGSISNWEDLCEPPIPTHNGQRINDCEAGMLNSIAEGVAFAARYIRYGNPDDAAEVLCNAYGAADEGAWRSKTGISFNQWVVFVALPTSFDCRELDDALIYG